MRRSSAIVLGLCLGGAALADKPAPADKGKPVTIKVPPLPPSTEDLLIADLAGAAWVGADKLGYPKGAEMAFIGQDPVSTGPTVYVKTVAGYHLPAHWHVHTEYTTMISGKGSFVVDGKPHAATAGTYVVVPGKVKHEFTCDAGAECVFVVRRSGPADVTWVKGPPR
jgi:quercetin dioxygenase-like cupin family protein